MDQFNPSLPHPECLVHDGEPTDHELRMHGKVVCISGGWGCVGEGIIRAWLAEGATVIAPLKEEGLREQLMRELEGVLTVHLSTPIVDLSDEEGAAQFTQHVREQHPQGIDYAISTYSGWWHGGLTTEQPLSEFKGLLSTLLSSHFCFAKAVWSLLKQARSSCLIFITNSAGQTVESPDTALNTVAMSGLYGLIMALRSQGDAEQSPVRIVEMRISSIIKRHAALMENGLAKGRHAFSNRRVGVLSVHTAQTAGRHAKVEVNDHALADTALTVNS